VAQANGRRLKCVKRDSAFRIVAAIAGRDEHTGLAVDQHIRAQIYIVDQARGRRSKQCA
jgi:hypothetical protein